MRRSNNTGKKFKRPKQKTEATTNPDAPRVPPRHAIHNEDRSECPNQVCPLLAKDSEWVDIVQPPFPGPEPSKSSNSSVGDEEAVLQLVDCEEGPESEPLAIMFPGLLEKDPKTFEGMLTKAMSTTEVTRNLVGLGAKANFQFVKKSERLIPPDKKWLDKLSEAENSNSQTSLESKYDSISSHHDADDENTDKEGKQNVKKKRRLSPEHHASTSRKNEAIRSRTPSSDSSNNHKFTNVIAALAIMDSSQPNQIPSSVMMQDEIKPIKKSK